MRFSKIKYNGERVVLLWVTLGVLQETEHTMTALARPAVEFVDALQAFRDYALTLLELNDADYDADLRVTGLSLAMQEDGRRGVVVTLLKKLKGAPAPLVLNTPYLAEAGDGDGPALDDDVMGLIEQVEKHAAAFVAGKRAPDPQGSLFPAAPRARLVEA